MENAKKQAMTKTQKQAVEEAENMLQTFEGMISSCCDRGALPRDLHNAAVKLSKTIRTKLRKIPVKPD